MTVTAGALSIVSVASTSDILLSAAATAGTGPYTYQWYRSTVTGFSPGGGNIIAGATALTLNDSGLVPGTQYYYKVVATDTGASNATSNSAQLAVQTLAPVLNPNQFQQSPYLGSIDLRFPYNSVSVQIDVSQTGSLSAGTAVKMVNSAGGVPKVVACSADTDSVLGFINFDIKTISYVAGSRAEISMAGNAMYLYSTGAIARGTQVTLDLTTIGGVAQATGSSNNTIVGWAFDQFSGAGSLARVFLITPSFLVD